MQTGYKTLFFSPLKIHLPDPYPALLNLVDKYIDNYLKRIEEFEINKLCKNKPKFDFTYLENDIILATIEGESIDEIVKNALTKYRK